MNQAQSESLGDLSYTSLSLVAFQVLSLFLKTEMSPQYFNIWVVATPTSTTSTTVTILQFWEEASEPVESEDTWPYSALWKLQLLSLHMLTALHPLHSFSCFSCYLWSTPLNFAFRIRLFLPLCCTLGESQPDIPKLALHNCSFFPSAPKMSWYWSSEYLYFLFLRSLIHSFLNSPFSLITYSGTSGLPQSSSFLHCQSCFFYLIILISEM